MATATTPELPLWMTPEPVSMTLADLFERFGPMAFDRIRAHPAPGTAVEEDVVVIHDREKRLYELVDGILVGKTMGAYESYLTYVILRMLGVYVDQHKLGILLAPDGLIRLGTDLIRIPDVSFISADRLPGRRVPRDPVCPIVPDLAIEILSAGNTKKEMADKLADYFRAGVRMVWYIEPATRSARVFTTVDHETALAESDTLDGGEVLPGLAIPLRELFAEPLEQRPEV